VGAWAVMVAADRFDAERLYQRDGIVLAGLAADGLAVGDRVMLATANQSAGRTPGVFAVGTVSATRHETLADADDLDLAASIGDEVAISYGMRLFDRPRPLPPTVGLVSAGDVVRVDESEWTAFADESHAGDTAAVPAPAPAPEARRTWLVSLDLPIEATSAAEAVRQFWTYVADLGPRELPTFVSPADDELAMQAMVGGVEVNLDPEEDD
jgi:hypothetical protein